MSTSCGGFLNIDGKLFKLHLMSTRTFLTNLPEYIYYYLQDYLIQDDYQQFLNTSKKSFGQIRRKTIIYQLTEKNSIRYCEDEYFRSQLLEKVENPLKQIIIKLTYFKAQAHKAVFEHRPVHVICAGSRVSDPIIFLQYVKETIFSGYGSDITSLFGIEKCEKVSFRSCSEISDISLLKDCKHITLDDCQGIADFSSLGRQDSLCIQINERLSNVANFRSIRTLILEECSNITDVSSLHGVYDLTLNYCWGVTDISSLGGHYRLEISGCNPSLTGYQALKNIPNVKLFESTISDVSVLSNAKVVFLAECESLVDVSALSGVRELTLRSCPLVEDISMLRKVQSLSLYNLPQLKSYEGINQMKNLSFSEVNDFSDGLLERFPNVKSIEIFSLKEILPSFTNLHSLKIAYSEVIVEGCLDVHTVILERCTVKSIRGLGKNRVVRLLQCKGVVLDVSCLATVPLVSIIKCQFKQVNYESLINVPRLKIDEL